MPALAADRDHVAASAGQRSRAASSRVEDLATLVERHCARLVPSRTSPVSGASAPVSRLSKVVLPAPLGPMIPTRSPRIMRVEKLRTIGRLVIGLRNPFRHGDQPARHSACVAVQPVVLGASLVLLSLLPQRVQFGEPALVARASGGDAIAQPILLPRDLAAELVVLVSSSPGSRRARPRSAEALSEVRVMPRSSHTVVRDNLSRKRAIMADQHDAGARAGQLALQPFDAGEVEMVGRLVEQQDVGRRSQRPSQRGATCLAAGQRAGIFLAGKAELLQQIKGPVSIGAPASNPAST